MKNVIYYTVHLLCILPTALMILVSILIFFGCAKYLVLCILLPISCVTVVKLFNSYKSDVVSVLRFIEKIKKDFSE